MIGLILFIGALCAGIATLVVADTSYKPMGLIPIGLAAVGQFVIPFVLLHLGAGLGWVLVLSLGTIGLSFALGIGFYNSAQIQRLARVVNTL
jgi:hypothetical protein